MTKGMSSRVAARWLRANILNRLFRRYQEDHPESKSPPKFLREKAEKMEESKTDPYGGLESPAEAPWEKPEAMPKLPPKQKKFLEQVGESSHMPVEFLAGNKKRLKKLLDAMEAGKSPQEASKTLSVNRMAGLSAMEFRALLESSVG